MELSSNAYKSAKAELDKRRADAEDQHEKKRLEIAAKFPEISRLEKSILNTSFELSNAICTHNGNISEIIDRLRTENLSNQRKIEMMLVNFGYPSDYLKPKYTCEKCKDTGFVSGIRCDCLNRLINKYQIVEISKNCHIKLADFSDFRLEYYPNTIDSTGINPQEKMRVLKNYCIRYAEDFSDISPSLFMLGKTGLGKTFLSSCIAKKLMLSGKNVAFDSVQNFLTKIQNEQFGRESGNTVEILTNADLVILDDLGSEFSSSVFQSALYNIINNRINLEKPMIVSTNMSLTELNEKYDDRIISRLLSFEPLRFFGVDIRQVMLKLKHR